MKQTDRTSFQRTDSDDSYLELISALIDGELENQKLLEVIDRIADTEDCRSFYRKSRALSGVIAAAEPAPAMAAPPALWSAIAERAGLDEHGLPATDDGSRDGLAVPRPIAAFGAWLGKQFDVVRRGLERLVPGEHGPILATLAILIAVGGLTWIGLRERGFSVSITPAEPEISETSTELAAIKIGSSDDMSDTRFINLATEILQADQRYRQELLRLMTDIEAGADATSEGLGEGYADGRSERSRSRETSLEREALGGEGGGTRVRVPTW